MAAGKECLVWLPKDCQHYQYQFSVPGMPRQRGNTKLASKALANAWAIQLRDRLRAESLLRNGKCRDMPLKFVVVEWFEKKGSHKKSGEDAKHKSFKLMDIIGADTMMSQIDDNCLLNARNRLKTGGFVQNGKARSYKNGSINAYMRQMRCLHRFATTVLKLAIDPINWKELHLSEGKQRTREYSYTEEAKMFEGCDGYAVAGRFSVLSGFRKANFTQLRWSEVHWERMEIELEVTKVNDQAYVVPISAAMAVILRAQVGLHPEFVFTFACQSTRTNPTSGQSQIRGQRYPLTYSGYTSWFRRRAAKLGYKITIHDGRRTAGGRTLEATGDITLVQSHLQLSSLDIARKRYGHTRNARLRDALEQVAVQTASARALAG